jgi:hypothetical protein
MAKKPMKRTGDGRILAENREGKLHLRKERADGWSDADRATFLDHLAASCNVALAARAVGRIPQSASSLYRRDPDFAAEWDRALDTGYANLEAMLLERAQRVVGGQPITGEDSAAAPVADMTTEQAMNLLRRNGKKVAAIRSGNGDAAREGRSASAKETYLAIMERMRVLKIRLDDGDGGEET